MMANMNKRYKKKEHGNNREPSADEFHKYIDEYMRSCDTLEEEIERAELFRYACLRVRGWSAKEIKSWIGENALTSNTRGVWRKRYYRWRNEQGRRRH